MRILQDPEEIPFAQTLTVAPEKLSRRSSDLACSRGTALADSATNEVESILARET